MSADAYVMPPAPAEGRWDGHAPAEGYWWLMPRAGSAASPEPARYYLKPVSDSLRTPVWLFAGDEDDRSPAGASRFYTLGPRCEPPAETLAEVTRQRDEAVKALVAIVDLHVPDQPSHAEMTECAWALRHVGLLRRIAGDALTRAGGRP